MKFTSIFQNGTNQRNIINLEKYVLEIKGEANF